MSKTFKTHCDEFFGQDVPFDAASIKAVVNNQKAIHDETGAVVGKGFAFQSGALDSTPDDYQTWATIDRKCVFFRPYLLTPGLKSIEVHINCTPHKYDGTAGEAVIFQAGEGVVADFKQTLFPLQDGATDTYVLTIPVRKVVVPELTLVQVWMRSTFEPSPPSSRLLPVYGDGPTDWDGLRSELVRDANGSFVWKDNSGSGAYTDPVFSSTSPAEHCKYGIGLLDVATQKVLTAQTVSLIQPEEGSTTSWELNLPRPIDLFGTNADVSSGGNTRAHVGLVKSSYVDVTSIAFKEVREDSDTYLDTVPPENHIPGRVVEAASLSGAIGPDVGFKSQPRNVSMSFGRLGCGAIVQSVREGATITFEAPLNSPLNAGKYTVYYAVRRLVNPFNTKVERAESSLEFQIRSGLVNYQERVDISIGDVSRAGSMDLHGMFTGATSDYIDEATGQYIATMKWITEARDWGFSETDISAILGVEGGWSSGQITLDIPEETEVYGDGTKKPGLQRINFTSETADVYAIFTMLVRAP